MTLHPPTAVAAQLGVSRAFIYREIQRGKLKAHLLGAGRGRLRISDQQILDIGVFTPDIPNAELADAIITVAAEHRQEPTP